MQWTSNSNTFDSEGSRSDSCDRYRCKYRLGRICAITGAKISIFLATRKTSTATDALVNSHMHIDNLDEVTDLAHRTLGLHWYVG